jgi:hypothetical protein
LGLMLGCLQGTAEAQDGGLGRMQRLRPFAQALSIDQDLVPHFAVIVVVGQIGKILVEGASVEALDGLGDLAVKDAALTHEEL